jgi:hypothetical protein
LHWHGAPDGMGTWGSETTNVLTRQLPSKSTTRSTPTTPRRGRPRPPAPPPPSPSLFSRGRRGGPPHQELPPVNHWLGLFGLSSTSSSSSSNCLDSGIKNRIRVKSPKNEIVSSSSSLESKKEERKYDGEEKEEQAGSELCQAQVQLWLVMLAVSRKKLRGNTLQIVTFHLKRN